MPSGLNWFQARDIAVLGWAIRRAGWRKWMIRRSHAWLMSAINEDTGLEERWSPRARSYAPDALPPDRTDEEPLAKDWTTEPWEGATIPPCCNPLPAPATAPNWTGGAAAWSLTDACGGAGDAGTVRSPVAGRMYALVITAVNGSVARSADPLYKPGTVVTLTATPDEGYTFDHWSGAASGSTNPLPLTMDASKVITAVFAVDLSVPFTLDVSATFNASIFVDAESATDADSTYDTGTGLAVCFTTPPARAKLAVSLAFLPSGSRTGDVTLTYNVGAETATFTVTGVNVASGAGSFDWHVFPDVIATDAAGTVTASFTPTSGYSAGVAVTDTVTVVPPTICP